MLPWRDSPALINTINKLRRTGLYLSGLDLSDLDLLFAVGECFFKCVEILLHRVAGEDGAETQRLDDGAHVAGDGQDFTDVGMRERDGGGAELKAFRAGNAA